MVRDLVLYAILILLLVLIFQRQLVRQAITGVFYGVAGILFLYFGISDKTLLTCVLELGMGQMFMTLFVHALTTAKNSYGQRLLDKDRDLLNLLRVQPGFTFRLEKSGDEFYYRLLEGELLERVGLNLQVNYNKREHVKRLGDILELSSETMEQLSQYYKQAWFGDRTVFELEFWEYSALITLHPVREDGNTRHVIGHVLDITEYKASEQKRKEMDEANRAKSTFLAHMSHEIRTPLNGIIGLSKLLNKTELTAVQRDYLHKLLASSRTLSSMLSNVLDFSKMEAGSLELEKVEFEPEKMLRHLADTVGTLLEDKEIEVVFITDPALPKSFKGDPLRMEQVLSNLLTNAIKFTNQGHVLLQVKMLSQQEGRVGVSFMVEDTGIGISETCIDKLFVPFIQASTSTSRRYGGSGLGLAISKHLAEAMGGKVEVKSRLGEYSQFYFNVELETGELNAGSTRIEKQIKGKALIVAQHELVRYSLNELLQDLGLKTFTNSSFQESVDAFQKGEHFDYVIIDMGMEGLRELDSRRQWLQMLDRQITQIIGLTTVFQMETIAAGDMNHSVDAFLSKPVTRNALLEVLCWKKEQSVPADGNTLETHATMSSHNEIGDTTQKYQILIAEDNEINQVVITEFLAERNFEVTMVTNGRELIALLELCYWDMVLLDLHMPEMDGFETARHIRRNKAFNRLPIIAFTADAVQHEQEVCLRAGINAVLFKPVHELTAARVLTSWINLAWLQDLHGIHAEQSIAGMDGKVYIFQFALYKWVQEYQYLDKRVVRKMDNGQLSSALRLIHSLKGGTGNLCAPELLAKVIELEKALKRSNETSTGALYPDWKKHLSTVQKDINQIKSSLPWS
ncbi:signal transduction histidine kinase/CheY-like chemotaxis protein [Paenibacillus sp. PvR133]|uniref:hybrid sensor histidine kinase/response regulator n=1 Tax=Paenibacillus sp. PvR133 TaxID=2806598 RepID=UPI001AEAD2FB|nr:hybrid sensor histidine kinase/response regulator [Paenibacillus sp. PvR133]MBP1176245.1 signal transduction histidine kinase/CheY-like chemotaxis protein [Paenibacillus sp. PvR133]